MTDDEPPDLELDDDVPDAEPARGSAPATAPPSKRRPPFGTLLAVAAVLAFAVLCGGVGGYFVYDRFWNTPERALKALVDAASNGDLPGARRYVSPDAWAISEPAVPEGLARALTHFYLAEEIAWTEESDETAAATWTEPTSIPEITSSLGVWMQKHDGHWMLARYEAGWGKNVSEATELIAQMRMAADARDAERFLERVAPGEQTCEGKACRPVADAISSGKDTPMLDTVRMQDVEPGSLRVLEEEEDIVMRWLRKTRFLGQLGMFEMRFREVDGRWMVVATDSSNFRKLDDEMETWTENHGEMLWRGEMSSYVRVKSLDTYCAEWFFGVCLTAVLPTHVQNVGTRTISSIKVSKVRALKYMGNASQTLWGIFRNIAPGKGTSNPSSVSPPVRTRSRFNENETWEFYRVNWVVFADGTRMDYSAQDYRETEGGTLAFEDVRTARLKGGLSSKVYDDLVRAMEASGYPPPDAAAAGGAVDAAVGADAAIIGEGGTVPATTGSAPAEGAPDAP
jgi:hypothetical protein